ncbi:Norsolorinic acid reductase [Hortaea werneckii]|nr:Norsolorinic acid reductase [Hortaea werneckii]KAI7008894.1 Norsolorinic acid reductase [Hortaea werneckii]
MRHESRLGRHRQLAPNAAIRVSPLCLGCMTFGDKQQERYSEMTKQAAFDMMDEYYKQGGNFLDTANGYQLGQSKEWEPKATKSNFVGNNQKSMKLSIEDSLKKLQTTYIDLFYVHWWDFTTTIPEVMHSLNDLVVAGKVLYLGISDTPAWVVTKANQYARDHGLRQFSVYQGMWSAAMRDFERDIIPMARDEGMALCPYGVLNQGRFQTQEGFKQREQNNPGRKFIPTSEHDKNLSLHLEKIAKKKGCGLLDIALQYCMQKTPYVFPIVGGRKVEHIQGNIRSLSVRMGAEDIEEVEEGYHFDPGFPHTFLSGTMFKGGDEKPRGADGPEDVWLLNGMGPFDWHPRQEPVRPS